MAAAAEAAFGARFGRTIPRGGGDGGGGVGESRSRSPSMMIHSRSTTTAAFGSLRDLLESTAGAAPSSSSSAAVVPTSPIISSSASASSSSSSSSSSTTPSPAAPAPAAARMVDAISISDAYDSGNGEFVSASIINEVDDDCDLQVNVKIRPDPFTDLEGKRHFQYFSFRSTVNTNSPAISGIFGGKKSMKVRYSLINACEASYADAFDGYSTFYAAGNTPFDPDSWTRKADARYEGGRLTWTHIHRLRGDDDDDEGDNGEEKEDDDSDRSSTSAYFAYFPPYSYERHLGLIARCAEARGASVKSLGRTISGREIDCVTVGTGPRKCWIIHRQHPGESMAEFYAEGLLNRLLGLDDKWDKVAERARELYTFHVVPNINPDGSSSGYLRTNAAGSNLNREWCPSPAPPNEDGGSNDNAEEAKTYEAPTLERSPEVYNLLRHMDRTGCDAFLDVHGDEALPFNFLAGSQGMGVWGKRLEALHGAFLASYSRANPDMQSRVSYDPDEPGGGMPNICSNQIAQRFDCFAGTLEMPFKELQGGETTIGWGPERARRLGASALDALCHICPYLRDDGEFWEGLPVEDAYIHPSSKY